MKTFPGRYAPRYDKEFILYIFGLRVNNVRKVRDWFGVMKYSYKIRTWLLENPQEGMLYAERGFIHGTLAVITYWNSFEELERFARDPDKLHIQGWRWYHTNVHKKKSVGMWHEMYRVRAGEIGGLYAHMPRTGLAAIGEHIPVGSSMRTAAQRMGLRDADEGVPTEVTGTDESEYEDVDRYGAHVS